MGTCSKTKFYNLGGTGTPTGPVLTVSTGPDNDPANATSSQTVVFGDTIHFYSPDGSILFTVEPGSALVNAQLNPTVLSGIQHTAITNIDLKPTGNANEYVVEIEWTDSDGNTQITTDATPLVISSADNIYTADGSLTAPRTVTQDGFALGFEGGAFTIDTAIAAFPGFFGPFDVNAGAVNIVSNGAAGNTS